MSLYKRYADKPQGCAMLFRPCRYDRLLKAVRTVVMGLFDGFFRVCYDYVSEI